MKRLLILPFAMAALAGCAAGGSNSENVSQSTANCSSLTGAALVECQQQVQPAGQSVTKPFKMTRMKPVNGNFRGGSDSGGGMAGGTN